MSDTGPAPSEQIRLTTSVLVAFLLGGCVGRHPETVALPGPTSALILPGDRPLLTLQSRPVSGIGGSWPVMCVQPSPDWAVALSRSAQFSGSGNGGGATGSVSAAFNNSELVTQLAGRTAGVVALRDGLYEACRAYVSGIIGQDAYALILSQYGDLLVALAAPAPASSGEPGQNVKAKAAAAGHPAAVAQPDAQGLKALLVACLSEADPTRLKASSLNPLLSAPDGSPSAACRQVVAGIARGADVSPASPPSRLEHRPRR